MYYSLLSLRMIFFDHTVRILTKVEPLMTATSPQLPLPFVPVDSPYIDSYLKPLYNGQLIATVSFFCPLTGLCAEVQLYFGFTKLSNKTTKFYLNGRCGTCLQVGFSFFELKSTAELNR